MALLASHNSINLCGYLAAIEICSTALELIIAVYFCNALSSGQLPTDDFHPVRIKLELFHIALGFYPREHFPLEPASPGFQGTIYSKLYSSFRVMSREKKIQFNVNEREYEKLKNHAEKLGLSMAEVLRDYIKSIEVNT